MLEQERFERSLRALLRHEGGYVDHPRDPGGATNLGITLGTARAWRLDIDGDGDVDKDDVRLLTPATAAPVYRDGYWRKAACDRLEPGLDYMIFDLAVNSGTARAIRYLQRAARVGEDGKVGNVTLSAARRIGAATMIERVRAERDGFYRSLDTFPTFGKGWLRRLGEVNTTALGWARAEVAA